MATKNDKIILKLKSDIESEKKLLKPVKRFEPITNCLLDIDGKKSNIRVLQKEELTNILVYLNMLRLSALDLNISEYNYSGYLLTDWLKDISSRLDEIKYKEKENKLKLLEKQLHDLLSVDTKVELEIDNIKNLFDDIKK